MMHPRKLPTPPIPPGWAGRVGNFLTHDYGSRLDRYVNSVRNPPAVLGLAAMGSILCGLFLHPQGFVLALGIAAVLSLGVVWPWVSVRGLSGSLAFERARAREGDPVVVHLEFRNRCPWGVWGLVVRGGLSDPMDADMSGGSGIGRSHLAAWSKSVESLTFTPRRRGAYPLAPPRIASGFPFGLRTVSRSLTVRSSLLVWPRTFPVGPIPLTAGGRSYEGAAMRDRAGHSGDLLGVRPYRRGDPLRRVHWPQTARNGELIVCELQECAVPRVQVVVDTHPEFHAGSGPDGSREWAIRIAASFCEGWIAEGADVEVLFAGRVVTARGGSVRSKQARFLDALALLGDEDFLRVPDLLDLPACRDFGRGLRVVIATDMALARIAATRSSRIAHRYVVLKAESFSDGAGPRVSPMLEVRPWVTLDDPTSIPRRLREAGKEVPLGH
jgi:uncharacterized protein (DUF58 family)